MALMLLVSAGLMIRTFQALRKVEPGFTDGRHLQTLRVNIPEQLVKDPIRVARMQNDIADKLAAIPGVTAAGFANEMPMEGLQRGMGHDLHARQDESGRQSAPAALQYAAPGFFHAAGTRLLAGRDFTWSEIYSTHPVAIISDNLAREFWGTPQAAIGKRIRELPKMPWYEVIGVVEDVRENGVDQKAPSTVYWPSLTNGLYGGGIDGIRSVTFVVRSNRTGTASFVNQVQRAVWSVESNLPVADIHSMQEIYDASLARPSFTLTMLGIAGAMALVLGIIGIYGVISYAVSQRRREIGIRLALGAQQRELKQMFVWSGLKLAAAGTVVGLAASFILTRFMKSLLYGISPLDPLTFSSVPVVLAIAVILASYLPARRAAGVDPVDVLKAD